LNQGITDEQAARLVGEVGDQFLRDELDEAQALIAMALVLDPGRLSYQQVPLRIRCRVAHLAA